MIVTLSSPEDTRFDTTSTSPTIHACLNTTSNSFDTRNTRSKATNTHPDINGVYLDTTSDSFDTGNTRLKATSPHHDVTDIYRDASSIHTRATNVRIDIPSTSDMLYHGRSFVLKQESSRCVALAFFADG
ncbi:hypothetical protein LSAT2_013613, partial [Lamellibrachia satsuma]